MMNKKIKEELNRDIELSDEVSRSISFAYQSINDEGNEGKALFPLRYIVIIGAALSVLAAICIISGHRFKKANVEQHFNASADRADDGGFYMEEIRDDEAGIILHIDIKNADDDIKMPVVEVDRHEINKADIDRWLDYFFIKNEELNVEVDESDKCKIIKYEAFINGKKAGIWETHDESKIKAVDSISFCYYDETASVDIPYDRGLHEENIKESERLLKKVYPEIEWEINNTFANDDGNNYIETITFYPSYEGNMVSDAKTDDNVSNSSVQVTFNNGSMRQAVLINPIEVVDIKETENVISRDDAYGIFKDNIINVMDLDDLTDEYGVGDYESVIYVNGIEKELVLTEKEDGVLEYVPAWIFVGGMDVTKNDVPYRMTDESAQTPLLIISAVDGRMLKVEK